MDKIEQKQRGKNHLRSHRQKKSSLVMIMLIGFVFFLCVNLVNAFQFDNVKGDLIIDETTSKYGKIEIRNSVLGIPFLQLGKVAEIELLENTDQCDLNCYAEGRSILYEEGTLIDSLRYNPKYDEIRNLKVFIKEKGSWIPYYNKELKIGNYEWRIEGNKRLYDNTDWWGTFNNVELTMWANWSGVRSDGLVFFTNMSTGSGTGVVDSSLQSGNGTFMGSGGGTVWTEGKYDNGIYINTAGEGLNISGNRTGLITQDITVEAWIKTNQSSGVFRQIVNNPGNYIFAVLNGNLTAAGLGGGTLVGTHVANDEWRHVAMVVRDSNSTVCLIVDGRNQTCHSGSLQGAKNTVFVGREIGGTENFGGIIDEIKIWNITRTGEEILSDMLEDEGIGEASTTLVSPPDNNINLSSNRFIFNCSSTVEETGLAIHNISLYGTWGDGWHLNETIDVTEQNTQNVMVKFNKSLELGTYEWNCLSWNNDTSIFAAANRTVTSTGFLETSRTFNATTIESSTETFIINIDLTEGFNIQSAPLIYNNTVFSSSTITNLGGNNYSIVRSIIVPAGNQGFSSHNNTWFFNITLANEVSGNTASSNTDTSEQKVNELSFGFCNGANLDVPMINFTMKNEIDGLEINSTTNLTTFQATFTLGITEANLIKNFSVNNISSSFSRYNFCTNETTNNFITDMVLFYTAEGFTDKNYALNLAPLSNTTNEIDLFLIDENVGVEFFIDVEQNLFPLTGATINVAKFFIGEGVFKTVEIDITDGDGKITSFLDLNKDYRFTITKDGSLLAILDKRAICQAAPCTLSLSITDITPNVYSGFSDLFASQVLYNLSYDPSIKLVTFEFVDTTGLGTSFRMDIIKGFTNGTSEIISTQRLFTSSGLMTYDASNDVGDFTARVFITRSPDQLIDFITYIISDVAQTLGVLGLFVAFLIVVTVIFGFAFSPRAFIFAIPLALTLVKLMGIISISNGAIVVIYLLAIVAATFISR